ncbi:MAG: AmmeMemoRadiSam system protein A [Peptococcaceae bacterium]|jgi:AmmeMemoRadiSam system protein A|nr:AmmeMemoRadiSam system protein A [Peptococcaceae bacterium]
MLCGVFFAPHPPILLPAIGKGEEKKASLTLSGFSELNRLAAEWSPDAVVCLTPHGPMFEDSLCIMDFEPYTGGLQDFGFQSDLSWPLNIPLHDQVGPAFHDAGIPFVHLDPPKARRYRQQPLLDHGAAVPLTLIPALRHKPLLCLTPGFVPRRTLYRAGAVLAGLLEKSPQRILVLASGDLAHSHPGGVYPAAPEGPEFDRQLEEAFRSGNRSALLDMPEDFIRKAAQCAVNPFAVALGVLDGKDAPFQVYSREAPYGVGYMTASALPGAGSVPSLLYSREKSGDPYVSLARAAVRSWVLNQAAPDLGRLDLSPDEMDALTRRRAGAFVSLHLDGALRGCIGTIQATQPSLSKEIIYCARQSCSADPRFDPVQAGELDALEIKVDILGDPEPVAGPEHLDARRYGVIVQKGAQRGLLLPDLEGVDTVEEQLDIARRKAGIPPEADVDLFRFEVERHG